MALSASPTGSTPAVLLASAGAAPTTDNIPPRSESLMCIVHQHPRFNFLHVHILGYAKKSQAVDTFRERR
jgi:hypothetical protein